MSKSVLFLGTGNTLYYPSGEATTSIKAFRAYFQVDLEGAPNGVKSFVLGFGEDDADGIRTISNEESMVNNAGWYDLNGRKLSGKPTQKGIYINNGHKLIIK